METTFDWRSKLRQLIPEAERRGVLATILLNMSNEERRAIFNDDDEAVQASLQHLHRGSILTQLLPALNCVVQSFCCCCAGSIDEERAIPDLNNEGPAGVCSISSNLIAWI
jgi:hypothetical protein